MSIFTQYYKTSFTFIDFPEPESYALSIFFTGCNLNCIGCHNPKLKKTKDGINITINQLLEQTDQILDKEHEYIKDIVLTGGDPLHPDNLDLVRELLIRKSNKYNFCIYTGQTEDVVKTYNLSGFKYIKTEPYIQRLYQVPQKTNDKFILSSSNQKLFDKNWNLLTKNGVYIY